jgi:lipopolysaccharide cholinephosphotransferase
MEDVLAYDRAHFRTLFWQVYRKSDETGLAARRRLHASLQPARGDLRILHETIRYLLSGFDLICRKNGIEYWLAGGTALGACRQGGFITWDNDADVFMMEEEFDKLVVVMENDKEFRIDNYTRTKASHIERVEWLPRIRTREAIPGVKKSFIDIFLCSFSDDASDISIEKLFRLRQEIVDNYRALRKEYSDFAGMSPTEAKGTVFNFLRPYQIKQRELMNPKGGRDIICPVIISNRRPYKNFFYDYNTIFPLQRVSFEGLSLYAPHHLDEFVTSAYGGAIWDLPMDMGRHPRNAATHEEFELMREFLKKRQGR